MSLRKAVSQTVNDEQLRQLGQRLRIDAVRASHAAGSGHPTSSMSAADLMAVLSARHLRYDPAAPDNPANDRLIFSKGHASPLLYALYKAFGVVSDEELLSFRKLDSPLEGHPTPRLAWVDVATGSLGQGLPIGVGLALTGKKLDRLGYRVWVLCGDSELAEGSMWEAFEQAGHDRLDNLVAIVDVNRLGQRGPTRHQWDLDAYARRIGAFGWHTIQVDGHDPAQIDRAYEEAAQVRGQPTAILARTHKGKGVSAVDDQEGGHGKPIKDVDAALDELDPRGDLPDLRVAPRHPDPDGKPHAFATGGGTLPTYSVGEEVPTRRAFGEALAALGAIRGDVVALDGEVGDSTFAELFHQAHPERYFEMYIAEQQMIAAAVGMQVRGWVPFAATFAAFLTRAHDFVRMAAVSRADLRLVGSHAGVAIGQDGPSQMGLEDLAWLRAINGSTVLYPSDANQTAQLVAQMADQSGISYLRTTRGALPVLYPPAETFPVGGSKVHRAGSDDQVTLVGAGVTLHQALTAADILARDGIRARVIDCYSVKPIDEVALAEASAATGALVVAEDHWAEGGLGDAVLAALADVGERPRVVKLAVRQMPVSGAPDELLRAAGIDADAIAEAARRLRREQTPAT